MQNSSSRYYLSYASTSVFRLTGSYLASTAIRGLQRRSATGLNDQAAYDEVSAVWRGAGCRKILLALRQGEVFFT